MKCKGEIYLKRDMLNTAIELFSEAKTVADKKLDSNDPLISELTKLIHRCQKLLNTEINKQAKHHRRTSSGKPPRLQDFKPLRPVPVTYNMLTSNIQN
jgi:hypothetical protein